MKKSVLILLSIVFNLSAICQTTGTMLDKRDSNNYRWITIGGQVWMAENLRYLPAVNNRETSVAQKNYFVYKYYGTDVAKAKATDNYSTYGVLYNWAAAMDGEQGSNNVPSWIQGACPAGWHLPSDAEWMVLEKNLGMSESTLPLSEWRNSGNIGSLLKQAANTTWSVMNGSSTNNTGFTAVPGGFREKSGNFATIGLYAIYWCAREENEYDAWARGLHYNMAGIYRNAFDKQKGLSVRCIKDGPEGSNTFPKPNLKVTPSGGDTNTVFEFDPNLSRDKETPAKDLMVRWDWDSDGKWDIDYKKLSVVQHSFSIEGANIVSMEVKDNQGARRSIKNSILIDDSLRRILTDLRDGNIYPYKKIGTQTWMIKNLAWLPTVSPSSNGTDSTNFYYVYGYEGKSVIEAKATTNYNTYGVLYNWPASLTACPPGWHLPTDAEWKILEMQLGMSQSDADSLGLRNSGRVGEKLKETGLQNWLNANFGTTNSTGFTALPGGSRSFLGGFDTLGHCAYFWSSSEKDWLSIWYRHLTSYCEGVSRGPTNRKFGYSVRCIQD